MTIGRVRTTAAWRYARVLGLSLVLGGCASQQVRRLHKKGTHEEVVRAAESARRPLRGAAARALAEAYVSLGQPAEARAVLQADFRRGGALRSLLALANLESSIGLDGIATTRWMTLAQLDPLRVENDPVACRLLLERGVSRRRLGEFAAADRDLELVEALCTAEDVRSMGEEATARRFEGYDAAVDDVVARHAPVRCEPPRCRPWDVVDVLDGPEMMGGDADATRDLLGPIVDEFSGGGPVVPMDDHTLRARLGHASLKEVEGVVSELDDDVAAYVRLRLARVWSDAELSEGERQTMQVRVEASSGPMSHGWMLRWLEEELTFAEFDIAARLRALSVPARGEAPAHARGQHGAGVAKATAGVTGVPGGHWAQTVPVRADTARLLLALARILARKGDATAAFRLRARVIQHITSQAAAGGDPQVGALAEDEILALLEEGRPWSALYLSGFLQSGPPQTRVGRACRAWRGMSDALCTDGCGAVEDRALMTRLLDRASLARLDERMLRPGDEVVRPYRVEGTDCGVAWRGVTLGGAWGALILNGGLTEGEDAPEELLAIAEGDRTLGCRTKLVTEYLGAAGHLETLELATQRRAGAAGDDSSMAAESEAAALLAMGAPRRASQRFEDAAALNSDPRAVWARAYVSSLGVGARELSLRALREVVLHSQPSEARAARRLLQVAPWRDLLLDVRGPAADLDAARRRSALERLRTSPSTTAEWEAVDWLMGVLARTPGASLTGGLRVMAELQPLVPLARHPERMAALFVAGAAPTEEGATMEEVLATCAMSGAQDSVRDGARCMSRVVLGTPLEAAQIVSGLLRVLPLPRRRAMVRWMLDVPGGGAPGATHLFPDAEVNLRMALGLSIQGWVDLDGVRLDRTMVPVSVDPPA